MRRLFLSTSLGVLSAFGLALPAAADESTPSATESETVAQADGATAEAAEPAARPRRNNNAIEEITVTARKREESLQDTPISITAFSDTDLRDQGISQLNDIQESVPNLQFDQSVGSANSARVSIRGVGNGDPIITDDPGVGIYVDGVYFPRAQGALLAVSDIQRIEVLRGPQGTLFGKNTIGGAVNIITQKPSFEMGGSAEVRAGNYDLFETKFVANLPIVPEMVASRISFSTKQRDGFTRNRLGGTIGKDKLIAGRAQLLVNATDNLEMLLSFDHSNEPNTPPPGKCKFTGVRTAGRSETATGADADAAVSGFTSLVTASLVSAVDGSVGPLAPGEPGDARAFQKKCEAEGQGGEFRTRQDGRFEDEIKTFGSTLIATWSPSDATTFKSTSSWRRNTTFNSGDADLTDLPISQDGRFDNDRGQQNAISQEFNLSGRALDDRLDYTLGIYGFYENNQTGDRGQTFPITNTGPVILSGVRQMVGPDGSQLRPVIATNGAQCIPGTTLPSGAPSPTPGLCAFRAFVGPNTEGFLKASTTSYAAYSQATFDVTENFSVTSGLRFTHERKRLARFSRITDPITDDRFTAATFNSGGITNNFERSARFDKWTPMLNLQYRFSDDVNVYATYSRGFKSGGFNGRSNETGGSPEFDPEILTGYEVGLKSRFLDDRLSINVAGYTSVYKDIQLTTFVVNNEGNTVSRVDNAGKAIINGSEVEFVAIPLPSLTLSGGVGITAARYVEFDLVSRNGASFSNVKLPNTPTYQFNVAAAYVFPLGSIGDLRTRIGWTHTGTKSSDVSDPHINRVAKHGVMNGRLALELSDGKTEIALFGNNLLDRTYFTNAVLGVTTSLRYYAPPRTYGIEINRKF